MNLDELERLLAVYNKHCDDSTSSVWQKLERMIAARIDLETALRNAARELIADARRFRWLTEDHSNIETRFKCRELLSRMGVMSYSAACASIDAAIAQEQK
jgi:hypothetical protein